MNTPTSDSLQRMTPDRADQIAAVIGTSEAMTATRIGSLVHDPEQWSEDDQTIALAHVFRIANAAIRLAGHKPTVHVLDQAQDEGWLECAFCPETGSINDETEEESITHDPACEWAVLVKTVEGEPV